jgi:hypothetical protein
MLEPAPTPAAPATHLQLIRVASRLFAAFLLFWVFLEVSRLPNQVLNLVQNMHRAAGNNWASFAASSGVHYMILGITVDIVIVVVLLVAARWFYRCDPRVQRFFSAEVSE